MLYSNATPLVAVAAESLALCERAAELARQLELPLVADLGAADFAYLLVLTPKRLELREQDRTAPGPLYADFVSGRLSYRRRFGGGRRQPLAKAIGLKGNANPSVLDATAGLGRDAFVLAALGCTVQLVERSPVIAALLSDGLARAAADPDIGSWVKERLRLSVADSRAWLTTLSEDQRPAVIYLDPMYPQRTKTALVKKEMRMLRRIVGEDQDAPALLASALRYARQRVVIKRPRLAPALAGLQPAMSIFARDTRFDVYL